MDSSSVVSLSSWHRNSTWKVCPDFIDFKTQTHAEIRTSIRCGNCNVNVTFKTVEISIGSPRGFFYFVSTSNHHNFCTWCFHFIISLHFLLWEPILNQSCIVLSWCNFKDIDVTTDIGTIGTISYSNFETTQITMNKDNFYFLQNNTNKDYNANIYEYKKYISSSKQHKSKFLMQMFICANNFFISIKIILNKRFLFFKTQNLYCHANIFCKWVNLHKSALAPLPFLWRKVLFPR